MERFDLRTATLGATQNEDALLELPVTATRQERHDIAQRAVAANAVIAIRFAKFNDGRGFSIARLLRDEIGFKGEILASGHVIPDQALHLLRAGFDTAELTDADRLPHWKAALRSYAGAYQTATRNPLQRRREASARRRAETEAHVEALVSSAA